MVQGAGQTGLWEDMAGRKGNIQTVRAFRKNIAVFAANSAEAGKAWVEKTDLDAWLIWNIWQVANKDLADLVPIKAETQAWPCARTARRTDLVGPFRILSGIAGRYIGGWGDGPGLCARKWGDPVVLDLLVEGLDVDGEQSGRLHLLPAGLPKDGCNVESLHLRKRYRP